MTPKEICRALRSAIKGRVHLTTKNSPYCSDFGGSFSQQPQVVVHARSEHDLRHTLQIAHSLKIPVSVRGAGHSLNGQTLTRGILIVYLNNRQRIKVFKNGLVEVPACVTWECLEKKLNQHGRSCPVLTDMLPTTVGGTLSVGGIGIRSCHYGAQIDQVVRFKLILPSGKAVWCSPSKNRGLFQFVLGGVGTLGIIERAVFRTIPYKPFSAISTQLIKEAHFPKGLDPLIQMLNGSNPPDWTEMWVGKDENLFSFLLLSGREHSKKVPHANVQKGRHFIASKEMEDLVKASQGFQHFWIEYVLDYIAAKEFSKDFAKLVANMTLPKFCVIYVLPIKRPSYSPDLPLHLAKEKNRLHLSIGLYFKCSREEVSSEIYSQIQDLISKLCRRCLKLGGRPYLNGACPRYTSEMRKFYGPKFKELLKLKAKYDPHQIFPFRRFWGD